MQARPQQQSRAEVNRRRRQSPASLPQSSTAKSLPHPHSHGHTCAKTQQQANAEPRPCAECNKLPCTARSPSDADTSHRATDAERSHVRADAEPRAHALPLCTGITLLRGPGLWIIFGTYVACPILITIRTPSVCWTLRRSWSARAMHALAMHCCGKPGAAFGHWIHGDARQSEEHEEGVLHAVGKERSLESGVGQHVY